MHISDTGARVVASDLEAAFRSADRTLHDHARLTCSIMETNALSTIPPVKLQGALESAAAGFTKFVEARQEMIAMQRQLIALKDASDIAVYDYGCFRFLADVFLKTNSTPKASMAA